ncbi:MAG: Pyruvate/2-oxoacid:ferredoxin oxidoreductase delta subunit [Chlamydiales bacterium]|jgi:Pyruvate/2-oxoacid:ferredoxin oxidoreductase delta subunit
MRVVLYEGPGAAPLEGALVGDLMRGLLEAGHTFTRPAGGGRVTPMDDTPMVVLGRFEGGVLPEIERAPGENGEPGGPEIHIEEVGNQAAPEIIERIGSFTAPGPDSSGSWLPWFPVLDYKRCTNCMQCLSFCLFDVYGVDAGGQIEVRNEDKCKTNCPACSRVCPEVAILFPKYGKGPINGDVVRKADIETESMKVDISALLGGDIYSSLRKRRDDSKKRFSTERDESRALLERKRCLKKLKKDLDIPDEVLMSLPSAGDITERAERAKEKMEKRMARSQTVQDARPAPSQEEWGI